VEYDMAGHGGTWLNALGTTNKQSETMGFLPPARRDFCQDASEVVKTSIAVHRPQNWEQQKTLKSRYLNQMNLTNV